MTKYEKRVLAAEEHLAKFRPTHFFDAITPHQQLNERLRVLVEGQLPYERKLQPEDNEALKLVNKFLFARLNSTDKLRNHDMVHGFSLGICEVGDCIQLGIEGYSGRYAQYDVSFESGEMKGGLFLRGQFEGSPKLIDISSRNFAIGHVLVTALDLVNFVDDPHRETPAAP